MRKKFPKAFRLLKSQQYQRVMRRGIYFSGKLVTVNLFLGTSPHPKLGITVSRRFGKAVQRSRFKRMVREAFRLSLDSLPPSLEIHVRPKQSYFLAKTQEIQKELLSFLPHVS